MAAQLKSETPYAAEVTRYDADRGRDVRRQRRRARREQRRECDKSPTAGDAVGDARTDSCEQVNAKTPPQWKGGDQHCPSLLKVKSSRTRRCNTGLPRCGHLPLATCTC